MAILTVRLPEDTHTRLKQLAKTRGISLNRLIEELSIAALAEFDAEIRFRLRAARGDVRTGLELLDKLDGAESG